MFKQIASAQSWQEAVGSKAHGHQDGEGGGESHPGLTREDSHPAKFPHASSPPTPLGAGGAAQSFLGRPPPCPEAWPEPEAAEGCLGHRQRPVTHVGPHSWDPTS